MREIMMLAGHYYNQYLMISAKKRNNFNELPTLAAGKPFCYYRVWMLVLLLWWEFFVVVNCRNHSVEQWEKRLANSYFRQTLLLLWLQYKSTQTTKNSKLFPWEFILHINIQYIEEKLLEDFFKFRGIMLGDSKESHENRKVRRIWHLEPKIIGGLSGTNEC